MAQYLWAGEADLDIDFVDLSANQPIASRMKVWTRRDLRLFKEKHNKQTTQNYDRAWWYMHFIPADLCKFEASLIYILRHCLKNKEVKEREIQWYP